ncbi:MAG: permease-like cell division protein FtsX [Candidatus Moranbacteria bacterium]|nr:permease-like cell division protein FtsX [Candidatus Moranbacteria bacterium]
MKTLKLWRTFKEGKENFRRNGWLTFATVSILTLSLFIVSLSFLIGVTTSLILENMRSKVSVSVSFNPDVTEERILQIKNELSKYTKEIVFIEYVSRDKALETFLAESGNDPIIAQAIKEIGENPLLASLIIKAVKPEDYPLIVTQIEGSTFQNDISRINYAKNKKIFERLDHINQTTKKAGLILGSIFIFVAILITFNTIRITIYSHRQEFEIMRLVGASNIYVRMPFVFEGALYGLVAAIITTALLFGMAYYFSPFTQGALPQGNLLNLYLDSFWYILGGLILLGISLGVVSSAIAIRRYLKV